MGPCLLPTRRHRSKNERLLNSVLKDGLLLPNYNRQLKSRHVPSLCSCCESQSCQREQVVREAINICIDFHALALDEPGGAPHNGCTDATRDETTRPAVWEDAVSLTRAGLRTLAKKHQESSYVEASMEQLRIMLQEVVVGSAIQVVPSLRQKAATRAEAERALKPVPLIAKHRCSGLRIVGTCKREEQHDGSVDKLADTLSTVRLGDGERT